MKNRVFITGDLMLDHYLWGKAQRISPEAPVPVVNIEKSSYFPGGAGNVAINLLALGESSFLLGIVGNDKEGKFLKDFLEKKGIDISQIEEINSYQTTVKSRVFSHHKHILRYDREEFFPLPEEIIEKWKVFLTENLKKGDIIIISDYQKGVITSESYQLLSQLAQEKKALLLVDPKKKLSFYQGAYLLKPNLKEFQEYFQLDQLNLKDVALEGMRFLKDNPEIQNLLVTLGEKGMYLLERGKGPLYLKTFPREVYDVTGAGDAVISALAFSLLKERNLEKAARFALKVAEISVGKLGTSAVSLPEVEGYGKTAIDLENLLLLRDIWKAKGKKIVFTNGCFDLLHPGHLKLLEKASQLGDILIVGLNSDNSVKRLKGDKRPLFPQDFRVKMLLSLKSVDYVVIFEEDTPLELIKKLQPDILVKGGDYQLDEIVGAKEVISKGGKVEIIPLEEGYSTTSLIEKICQKI